jgi:hypothetical protein
MRPGAWALVGLLTFVSPAAAHAQIFVASRPNPSFAVGPLFVRGTVTPTLDQIAVDIFFSIDVPAGKSASDIEQDLFLLWPGAVTPDPKIGKADPALEKYISERGFDPIDGGRVALSARNLYQSGPQRAAETIAGGAPFVTFVRDNSALGLSAPATWIRIPWNPRLANKVYLMALHLNTRGLIRDKPATWVERTLWGPRHRVTLSFNETRQRAVFPMYFQQRDRVIRLGDEPAQIMLDFANADHLKIDEMSPSTARRQLSETLDNTDTIALFLDRTEGITPQVLSVQFGYFTGLQSWAPVLIPTLFFVLGNVAGVLVRNLAERFNKRWMGRVLFRRGREEPPARQQGTVLEPETLQRIVPGVTTYEEVLRLAGPEVEVHSRSAEPERRRLVYRGRRVVPRRRRAFGWLTTVGHWDAEQHEVEIELERDVVRDVQARVTRSRLNAPETV